MSDKNEEILADINNIKTSECYTLPSKGLIYAPEDKIPGSITLKRMTTREDKIRMRNQEEDEIRKELLQACILDKDVDAGKLKLMDANFLLFRLRVLSLLDDTYKVQCFCPSCSNTFIHKINLSEVPVKFINETDMDKFEIILPICKCKIKLKYPSINDIIVLGRQLRDYFDKFPDADRGESTYSVTTMMYIDSVNDNKPMKEELEDWIDNMDILDSRALRDAIQSIDNIYGFDDNLKCKCPSCGREITHGLPITGELFNPSKD